MTNNKLTSEQAVRMASTNWWLGMSARDIAVFQMHEPLLCMPFAVFHEKLSEALGRDVYTHEFALNPDGLRKELMGDTPAPTLDEILSLVPAEKRIVLQ